MTRSLLSPEEAKRFGETLKATRKQANLSVTELARGNRTHWRKYESGAVIPSPQVLRRFAQACGVSEFTLLERAGYLEELLRPIVSLLTYGRTWPTRRKDGWERVGGLRVSLYSYVGVLLAIRGFPRRNEGLALAIARGYNPELDEAADAALAVEYARGPLPTAIRLAQSALRDTTLTANARRNVAAELVHDYVRANEGELYEALYHRIYQENPK